MNFVSNSIADLTKAFFIVEAYFIFIVKSNPFGPRPGQATIWILIKR